MGNEKNPYIANGESVLFDLFLYADMDRKHQYMQNVPDTAHIRGYFPIHLSDSSFMMFLFSHWTSTSICVSNVSAYI